MAKNEDFVISEAVKRANIRYDNKKAKDIR